MRRGALALAVLLAGSATPSPAQYAPPGAVERAAEWFNAFAPRDRVMAQVLLIATGHQQWVPTDRFNGNTFVALQRFQAESGLPATGLPDRPTLPLLGGRGRAMLRAFDFRLIGHPSQGNPIWMPQGLGLQPVPSRAGIAFQDPQRRLFVAYNFFPGAVIGESYEALRAKMAREGTRVHYAAFKGDWYVISATSANGNDQYIRYHQHQGGLLGFGLFWNNANGVVSGERIAILMSASLGASLTGRPMIAPPDLGGPPETPSPAPSATYSALPRPEAPAPAPAAPAPVPAPAPRLEGKTRTGTGFFVTGAGHLVTNAHVVEGCSTYRVRVDGQPEPRSAYLLATDPANDLALLGMDGLGVNRYVPIRTSARLGEGVAVFGFPHADLLASSGNFTLGNVTALAGLNDDARFFQISAPVQSGNSGGPLFDESGNVIGVVTSKLNVAKLASSTGDFIQNVNFAVKGAVLGQFLAANGITPDAGAVRGRLSPADTADLAKAVSGFVVCR